MWWCFILNEPFIITYPTGKLMCPNCNCIADSTGPKPSDYVFYGDHTFIASISKPVKSKEYLGEERGEH